MAKQNIALPSETTWGMLVGMQKARDAVSALLSDTESELKDARRNLDELGAQNEDSEEFRTAAAKQERCVRTRDFYKERLKTLADKINAAIASAAKGQDELPFEFDVKDFTGRPKPKDLYNGHRDEDTETAQLPIGKPGKKPKPEQPDASKGDGVDEHLNASVAELKLNEQQKSKLIDAGFRTIAQVIKVAEKSDDHEGNLDREIGGIYSKAVWMAVKQFRKEHRSAMREAEKS